MDLAELRRRVGAILEEEERDPVDWSQVERLTDELYSSLAQQPDTVVPELVDHFLDDADIRAKAKNAGYARRQREDVRHFVQTGEYVDSTPLPRWTCLLAVALLVALLLWIFL